MGIAGLAALALTLVAGVNLAMVGYLLLLTIAAVSGDRSRRANGGGRGKFAILVPAHNEEAFVRRLLQSLRTLDYPPSLYDVYVVADNCEDRTAIVARSHGANVFIRHDTSREGKGYALEWLLERIRGTGSRYEAYVVVDADSVLSRNFLRAMDARLERGSAVVQSYYSVLNAGQSPLATLRYIALAALHYARPLGRARLGLSCGLKGNGMCFVADVVERFGFRSFTLAEDAELHLLLVQRGLRVDFAPEASVLADMPTTFAQAASQNTRWERGRLLLARRHALGLLAEGLRRRDLVRVDAAIEQLIPPLSVLLALSALCGAVASLVGSTTPAYLGALAAGGIALHLLVAMRLVHAPSRAYFALAYAPVYALWKAALYARALLPGGPKRWIRTERAS